MPVDIASALRLKMGALNVVDGVKTPFGAGIAVFPATAEEAAEAVALAAESGVPVVPAGGGTYVDALAPVPPQAMLLSALRLNRIVEFQPENMVVTAEAGLPLAALQDALRRSRQYLPLNPPDPEVATLGGIVAAAATGSWRAACGGVRDWLLEVRAVDSEGRPVRGGARVVKNVAGYDIPKLYAGSRGTLGVITEVTFKTKPLPEQSSRLLVTAASWETVYERLAALAASEVRPAVLESVRADLRDPNERPAASILLEGSPEAVQWQTSACMQALRGGGSTVARVEGEPVLPRSGDVELTVRVRPTDTAAVMDYLAQNRWRGAAGVYPMEGRVTLRLVAHPDTPEQLAALRAFVEGRSGAVTVERMPRAWIGHVRPWGTPRPDAPLAQAVKDRLDPRHLFINPLPGA